MIAVMLSWRPKLTETETENQKNGMTAMNDATDKLVILERAINEDEYLQYCNASVVFTNDSEFSLSLHDETTGDDVLVYRATWDTDENGNEGYRLLEDGRRFKNKTLDEIMFDLRFWSSIAPVKRSFNEALNNMAHYHLNELKIEIERASEMSSVYANILHTDEGVFLHIMDSSSNTVAMVTSSSIGFRIQEHPEKLYVLVSEIMPELKRLLQLKESNCVH